MKNKKKAKIKNGNKNEFKNDQITKLKRSK